MNRVVFSSASDRWATPRAVYDALNAEFLFTFDPCPLDGTGDGLAPLFCEWGGATRVLQPTIRARDGIVDRKRAGSGFGRLPHSGAN